MSKLPTLLLLFPGRSVSDSPAPLRIRPGPNSRFFVNAHREYRLITTTASQAGFHQAHMDVGQQDGLDFSRDTSASLANLNTATAADRETVAGLTNHCGHDGPAG
jgi:hypothetical protein